MNRVDHARLSILHLIREGSAGDRLPGESDLATRIGVSRVTVRSALRQLWHEGLVTRRWGNGTFIAEPPAGTGPTAFRSIYVDVGVVGSLPERIRAAGFDVEIRGFGATTGTAPSWVAESMVATEDVWHIERTLVIDHNPGVYLVDYLPTAIAGNGLDPTALAHPDQNLPSLLAAHGTRAVKDEAYLEAVAAPTPVAAALNLQPGRPVLRARQNTHGEDGTVIECTEVHYNTEVFATVLVRSSRETQ
ncbi:GntR family transcriptional regulator [Streptomyces sp. yr375]|uniref:GntR family transcriptional regulator n=1 Tax=Streptomyces sp. yr375 TaxID=1761906 RepID=UPI0008C64132|nr:GntR family transcriptional regulator [Streptomyces sp. yr375]SEQ00794.1 GntR family transcriptional regulator [Streptomyces sp. yr375]